MGETRLKSRGNSEPMLPDLRVQGASRHAQEFRSLSDADALGLKHSADAALLHFLQGQVRELNIGIDLRPCRMLKLEAGVVDTVAKRKRE